MVANFVNRLTKTQYNILICALTILGYFLIDSLLSMVLPHSKIPVIALAMVLFALPIVQIRKKGRPEEFKPYTLKRRIITASVFGLIAFITVLTSDFFINILVK